MVEQVNDEHGPGERGPSAGASHRLREQALLRGQQQRRQEDCAGRRRHRTGDGDVERAGEPAAGEPH